MRHVTLPDFLTKEQIEKAYQLKNAKEICQKVIKPNIKAINKKLGQENEPMYLAYACEYVISQAEKN